jgi:hypothetical protein
MLGASLVLAPPRTIAIASSGPRQSLTQQGNEAPDQRQSYSGTWMGTWTGKHSPDAPGRDASADKGGENSNQTRGWLWKIWEWVGAFSAQALFTFVTTVATIFIAYFTFKLVAVTKDLHKATEAATTTVQHSVVVQRLAAFAAEKSAEAASLALNAERPYVFVEKPKLTKDTEPLSLAGTPIPIEHRKIYLHATFRLRNRGKGVAILHTVQVRLLAINGGISRTHGRLRRSEIVDVGDYRGHVGTQVLGEGDLTDEVSIQSFALSPDQWDQVCNLSLWLLLIIHVRLGDVFRRIYPARFLFDYDPTPLNIIQEGWLIAYREDYIRYKK